MSLEHYAIIDSTLREGEQFINAQFTQRAEDRASPTHWMSSASSTWS